MLLVLCVDLDDDLGRKTGLDTPVVGREAAEEAAVSLAVADPEDSDVNVIFRGINIYETITDESAEIAVVTGVDGNDIAANRKVGEEVDQVLASLSTGEDVRAVVVTDGAQDESVIPVIRSRMPIDAVPRVVVRQAQDLESMYYTLKQVLADPETRGTILVPLGILLLIYPLAVVADIFGLPGAVFGVTSALIGLYVLFRGLGIEERFDDVVERARQGLFTGRVTLVTSLVAFALLAVGGVQGVEAATTVQEQGGAGPLLVVTALVYGAIKWFAAAGLTSSLGRITDEYLAGTFRWRYLNAPFYVVAMAAVLRALSAYFLGFQDLPYLATVLTAGTLLGVVSTLAFAIAESRYPREPEPRAA